LQGDTVAVRTTFQKRQKEMKRQEKQRMKAERRVQRKAEKTTEGQDPNAALDPNFDPDLGEPHRFDYSLPPDPDPFLPQK
jgi:hypothetical protein